MADNIINYNDQRLTDVERERATRKDEINNSYNQMITERDALNQQQQKNINDWATQQTELQQARNNQTINEINQRREEEQKSYEKEQKGAYTDYMKQSNQYGSNAEMLARQGMNNSGYSESSKVSMWNTYQNRYASARDSFKKSSLEFDNMMKDAELSNNETLANIAYEKQQQAMQLTLDALEYKNNLTIQRENKIDDIDNMYNSKYQNVLNQINQEYEYAREQQEWQAQQEQAEKEYQLKLKELDREYEAMHKQWEQWDQEQALKKELQAAQIANLKSQAKSYSGYTLSDSSNNNDTDEKDIPKLTKNAKVAYSAYQALMKNPLTSKSAGKFEDYLQKQYNAGKINQDELKSLIYNYA